MIFLTCIHGKEEGRAIPTDLFTGSYASNDDIYKVLRGEILNLTLVPGQLISEVSVSKRFEVSRTPVRSVFERLRRDGLIEVVPRKGTFVTLLDLDMIGQIIYMRSMVEIGVMIRAAKEQNPLVLEKLRVNLRRQKYLMETGVSPEEFFSIDSAFHELCMNAAHKQELWQMICHLDVHYSRYRMLDYATTQRFEMLYNDHCSLFRLIETGQRGKLVHAVKMHLFSGLLQAGDRLITEYSGYFSKGGRSVAQIMAELRGDIDEL